MIAFRHNRRGEPILPRSYAVTSQPHGAGHLLFLPLCPSTNVRQIPVVRGRRAFLVNTPATTTYLRLVGLALKMWVRGNQYAPIAAYCGMDCWFVLPRTNCDPHNYFKVLCDALEYGGVVVNDKYLLPRIRGVWHDGTRPEIIVALPGALILSPGALR